MAVRTVVLQTGSGPDRPAASGEIKIRRFNPGSSDDGTFIHAVDENVALTYPASSVSLEVGEYFWFTPIRPRGNRILALIPAGSGSILFKDLVPVDESSLTPTTAPLPAWFTDLSSLTASHVSDGSALDAALTAKNATLNGWASSKIVCLGDSITGGNQDGTGTTYPGLIATALPWATVTNFGRSGWTSTELANLAGVPFVLGSFTTATDTTTKTPVTITYPTGDYRAGSSVSFAWTGELRLADGTVVPGLLEHDATGLATDGWTFKRTTGGSAVSVPADAQFVCTEMDAHRNSTLIFGAGANNFLDPATILRDVAAVVNLRKAVGAPWLVLAVPNSQSETNGTKDYNRKAAINAALAKAYPANFVDDRAYLIRRGLAVTATTATSTDVTNTLADIPPASLMFDTLHPNQKGYKAKATVILAALKKVGAVPKTAGSVAGVNVDTLGPTIWDARDIAEQLGVPIDRVMDRDGRIALQANSQSTAPIVALDNGRRVLRFDGVDDQTIAETGTFSQAFTIIARLKVRSFDGEPVGIARSFGTGTTFEALADGRLELGGSSGIRTAAGAVAEGQVVTVVAVANGASSKVGVVGTTLSTGNGGSGGMTTKFRIGYAFPTTTALFAAMDLHHIRVYPWALDDTQIAAAAATIETGVVADPTAGSNLLASGQETFSRHLCNGSGAATNANVRLTYFTARKSTTVNNLRLATAGTAAGATPTLVRLGIYQVATDGALTLVASTANDTTLFAATSTPYTKVLSAPWTPIVGQRYAVAVLVVTGATAPTLVGNVLANGNEMAIEPKLSGIIGGQTDLPASITAASVSASPNCYYVAMIP